MRNLKTVTVLTKLKPYWGDNELLENGQSDQDISCLSWFDEEDFHKAFFIKKRIEEENNISLTLFKLEVEEETSRGESIFGLNYANYNDGTIYWKFISKYYERCKTVQDYLLEEDWWDSDDKELSIMRIPHYSNCDF